MNKILKENIEAHKKALAEFEANSGEVVERIAEMIIEAIKQNGCVYLCGNGGSAGDCQHIAGEFVGRFRKERDPLPAVALSTDTSVITCIGNDYSFDEIFTRQVEALVKPNDVLWAFSTSGESKNVVAAAESAKQKGAKVIAFTGRADSKLEKIADLCLCPKTPQTSTAQEIHQLAYHTICDMIDSNLSRVTDI